MTTTQELVEKYQISKVALLKRVDFLKIQPHQGARGAFVFSQEQVDLLDQLHEHLKANNTMESFIPKAKTKIIPSIVNSELTVVDAQPFYLDHAPDCINKEVNDWFNLNQRLKYYWILEGLSRTDWGLTKEEIKELTDCNIKGDRYSYDCFIFVRSGKVKGKQTWIVRKNI